MERRMTEIMKGKNMQARAPGEASAELLVSVCVNVSYRNWLTAEEIARVIRELDYSYGQLSCFFGEIPIEDQLEFAVNHGITRDELIGLARKFHTESKMPALLVQ